MFKKYTKEEQAKNYAKASKEKGKNKLGSGNRFKKLSAELSKKGVKKPGALAAWIGRNKYGSKNMAKLSSKGKGA